MTGRAGDAAPGTSGDGPGLLLVDGVDGRGRRRDVRVQNGRVVETGPGLLACGEAVHHCAGGAVLPGLHDHHLHLLATAAEARSVACGPPRIPDAAAFVRAVRAAPVRDGWVRGTGYDESVAGLPDRLALDTVRADVPVRVQHRSGAVWLLNSAALTAIGADTDAPDGVERDAAGRATGRLWRVDGWLRSRIGPQAPPSLAPLSRLLASFGITGVTDATPDLDRDAVRLLERAREDGDLVQRTVILGADTEVLDGTGPRKIVVADHDLPGLAELSGRIRHNRGLTSSPGRPRAVALHCVTREALLLAMAALEEAGPVAGDRIEHAAVVPAECRPVLRRLGLTVVTQPSLVARRGEEYLRRVHPDDVVLLWPLRTLLDAGVPVGCSSDAPYGDPDPWAGVRAAVERRAPSGAAVAPGEAVDARVALRGYLTRWDAPGGPVRRVRPGAAADLVVLDRRLAMMLARPDSARVAATFVAGRRVH